MKQIGGLLLCLLLCLPSTLLGQSFVPGGHPVLIWFSENVKVNPYAQVGFQWVGSNLNLPIENEIFPAVPIEIAEMDVSLKDANFWTGTVGFNILAYEKYSLFAAAGGFLRRPFITAGTVPVNIGSFAATPSLEFTNSNLESWFVQTGVGLGPVLLGLYWSHFGFEFGEPRVGSVPLANQTLRGDILTKTFAPFVGIAIPASGAMLTLQYSPIAYSNTNLDLISSQAGSTDLRYSWKKPGNLIIAVLHADLGLCTEPPAKSGQMSQTDSYTGSVSCRKCHEKFYQLWAPSHHGLAMQPYTAELARDKLSPQMEEIVVGDSRYRADIAGENGWVTEQGPEGEKKYRIDHAMGGKNVYYFLTAMDRGRLQTLPVAFDVNKKEWFDMAGSGVRHFPGQTDEPIHWKDWQYTFNTACYGCHVSQVSTNYDMKTDTYRTVWKEPGINCETCHGPADEHIRVCEAAPKGTVPKDLKLTRGGRDFSKEQNNATCSTCHAKAVVLTDTFQPGDRFFDHFGLVTLENPDYYPDGRDLGENYTYTSWLMSPCVKSGKLDCLHCHTSSGRYKFKAEDKANQACMPCHQDKVDNPTEHTHHKADSPGNKCISCHMPMTEFARMRRSDHSMLPPSPAATIAFNSPNACNICHKDKTPQWADETVRTWRKRDYQAAVLHRAGLINAARTRDWSKLPEMLDYVMSKDRDEIFATSLIRLVQASGDPRVVPALLKAIKDPSPLIRSAVATALQNAPTEESVLALAEAAGDDYRLVRVRAAASLAGYQNLPLTDSDKKKVEAANKEYLASILSRPDQWDSHYNLGNYYLDRRDFKQAVDSYEKALEMEPRGVLAMVNEAMAYARMGENQKADDALQKALKVAPDNAAANFNMGLLKAEENDLVSAEKHLRAALKTDPQMAQAAYNLCVILSKDRLDEAVDFCRKATEIRSDVPRYAFTLAFYQQQKGDLTGATGVLDGLITKYPAYADAYVLLGGIYEKQGKKAEAEGVYNRGLAVEGMPDQYKVRMKGRLEALKGAPPDTQKK